MTKYTTHRGHVVTLGRELARGGEGAVFDVVANPLLVAKIYHKPPAQDKSQKLRAMAKGCTDALSKVAAWPSETLHIASSGAVAGFLMRRVDRHKDIHVVYGPKTRLREFPQASYRLLVRVAGNLARAFQVVHEHGHFIGDVNSGGACVSQQGTITLVDCDSFQVLSGSRIFPCDVGIPIYQPPEFQSIGSFRGVERSERHDCFGLAVLVFQTLFLARHPFAGRYLDDGDMPIERAIQEFRFPYARDAAKRRMQPPPNSLQLGSVTSALAEMFERAFLEKSIHGRPTARDWARALDDFEAALHPCSANSAHAYLNSLASCALCSIESRTKLILFLPPVPSTAGAPLVDLERLWTDVARDIARVDLRADLKSAAQVLASGRAMQSPAHSLVRTADERLRNIAFTCGLAVLLATVAFHVAFIFLIPFIAIGYWVIGRKGREQRRVAQAALAAATQQRARAREAIAADARSNPVYAMIDELNGLREKERELVAQRGSRLRELEQGRFARQQARFLDGFVLADSRIRGFGPELIACLESYGVETADDITPSSLQGIPGIGSKRQERLLAWKQEKLKQFAFRADDHADVQERACVEQEMLSERARVHSLILTKARLLREQAARKEFQADVLRRQYDEAVKAWTRAATDAKFLGIEVQS